MTWSHSTLVRPSCIEPFKMIQSGLRTCVWNRHTSTGTDGFLHISANVGQCMFWDKVAYWLPEWDSVLNKNKTSRALKFCIRLVWEKSIHQWSMDFSHTSSASDTANAIPLSISSLWSLPASSLWWFGAWSLHPYTLVISSDTGCKINNHWSLNYWVCIKWFCPRCANARSSSQTCWC